MSAVPLVVAVPLLAAAALAAFGSFVRRWMAEAVALGAVAASAVFATIVFARSGSELLVYWFGGWTPRQGIAIGVSFAIDPIGAGLALFAATLMLVALLFSIRYLEVEAPWFAVIMLVFLAGMQGLALSGDLFDMFVFFELMSVAAYALAGYNIEERAPLVGSQNFGITKSVG
jgi:multicomponent Na+:H+ antiporter subunit D